MATFEGGIGGWFGDIMEAVGLADRLVGEGRKKLLVGKAQKDIKEAEKQQLKIQAELEKNAGKEDELSQVRIAELTNRLKFAKKDQKEAEERLRVQESGKGDLDRIAEIEAEITAEKDSTFYVSDDKIASLEKEKAALQKGVDKRAEKKGGMTQAEIRSQPGWVDPRSDPEDAKKKGGTTKKKGRFSSFKPK